MKSTVLKENSFIHLKKHGLLYLLFVIVLAVVFYRIQLSPNQKTGLDQERPEVGHPAPDFTLRNLQGNLEGLTDHKDKVVILNFWATWCGPCKAIAPVIDEIAGEYNGKVKVGKVDVDQNQDTAMKYGVRSIPTLLIMKDGKVVNQIVGAVPKRNITTMLDEII